MPSLVKSLEIPICDDYSYHGGYVKDSVVNINDLKRKKIHIHKKNTTL